ncbi:MULTISPECIES: dephospho-CoA kinase [Psychrilyobacter]|uniref:Dephospho-CoA kinase n=1 Tax=Psychrilyobacter piezotolerans TaxID=2293438 RepID=A0ABX9KCY3_9FUSO|nr:MULTISPECIES: dephospho-CoA kinase [Psychrilyobacter]MCS5422881.1 dephospho-CoA kinase [Psychrilyobacter sp. S5]NDI79256.1 dephospho-CoA kinase [Psychrilyobacter piezotolerans]RDE58818.1 dephospho-CoA kinase [Psychrilyobacter sp. S5]REI39307.1 dephospho-CoA kinase [Psychrilyobacter piezotolerans]
MILGLTGGIASGKSTVSKRLKELGSYIIDADKISREVSDSLKVLKKLEQNFGPEIIDNGHLDRQKLREIVFENKEKRELLNEIMHPVIVKKIIEEIEKNREKELIILDIPLLYETGLEYLCDKVLVVCTDEEIQIERVKVRDGIEWKLAKKIIDAQMPLRKKINKADIYIENNGNLEELLKKVELIYREITK